MLRLAATLVLLAAACRQPSADARARRAMAEGKAQLALQTPAGKQAALAAYGEALRLWEDAGDLARQAEAAGMLGEVHDNLGDMAQAAAWSARALELYRRAGDRHGEAMALGWVGIAEVHLGQVAAALPRFREALAIARAAGDREAEGYALLNLAFGLARSETPSAVAEAIAANEAALPVYEALRDPENLAVVHNNLGRAALLLGDAARALHHHRAALEIRTREDLRLHVPWSYLNLAEVHLDLLDEPAIALDLDRKALDLAIASGNRLVEPYARHGLGAALLALDRPAEALPQLEQALAGWATQGPDRAPAT
ncbi:MAG TPA: tetratricopeptide repeat protein, partial [Kofleriaceae bacterium]|nr:tetratricopeptide repeat protein [Kofleriaceae bacterium]